MAERGRTAALITGAIGGSLVTLLLTRVAEARAAGPPPGVDPETWEMYLTIIETTAVQAEQINELIVTLNNLAVALGAPTELEDPFASMPKFIVGHVVCPIANTAYRLPPIPVPKNKQLVVTALPGNITWLWVANTPADSTNMNVAYPLVPTAGVGLFVKNANSVWVMANTINDGVAFIVEQE